jgi:hypothetical protein
MAVRDRGATAPKASEETPLLRDRLGVVDGDDASSGTLTYSRERSGEEEVEILDKANQQVGRGRGLLIILSLWGLIFLQG